MPVKITLLADRPELASELARLYVSEWEPYYGSSGPGNAERDLAECVNRERIPLAVIALNAAGELLGSAALKHSSVDCHSADGPWLAALVVQPRMRSIGIAGQLVRAIEAEARRLGYKRLYTAMSPAETKILDGWVRKEDGVATLRQPVSIFFKSLAPRVLPLTSSGSN